MNKIKQRREELEKGCGEEFSMIGFSSEFICGRGLDLYDNNPEEVFLCPICEAQLQELNFADKERLKWFRELIEGIECNAYDNALWLKQMITNKLNEEEKNEN